MSMIIVFNPYLVNGPILYLLKTKDFLVFSGVIKWEQGVKKKVNLKPGQLSGSSIHYIFNRKGYFFLKIR